MLAPAPRLRCAVAFVLSTGLGAGCYAGSGEDVASEPGSTGVDDSSGSEGSSGEAAPPDDDSSTGEGASTQGDESDETGSDETTGAVEPPVECLDYGLTEHFLPTASFTADVVPVFQRHCNAATCHSSSSASPAAGLRLGEAGTTPMSPGQISNVHAAIVGVAALKAEMKLVEPGEPAHSFLLAKTEYAEPTDCDLVVCKPAGCGVRMPMQMVSTLAADEARALRTWIRDGAPLN